MERHNCLMIFCFLIRGAFLIIFGACIMIFGALVAIIGASDLILGSLSKVLGANILLLGANNLLFGAQRFGSYSIIFGAFATWYSLSQYIWSPKLLQSTCSHRICETGPQSPPFRLVTWSPSGSGTRIGDIYGQRT